MKKKIFLTSDTHFNHANIIKYCNRPFIDVKEMNEELIKRWNEVVSKNDIVYHLGDFGFSPKEELKEIIDRLNGYKILIMGNHDYRGGYSYYKNLGFDEIYRKELIIDNKYILTHHPIKVEDDKINFFGHIHDKPIPTEFNDNKHICVCVDKWNFHPIEFKFINNKKKKVNSIYYIDGKKSFKEHKCINNPSICLYSKGIYETLIRECDLPDYYIKIRCSSTWYMTGYIKTKGVVDLKYRTSQFNRLLKDETLYISYNKPIIKQEGMFGIYKNYDFIISGNNIIKVLLAIEKNSNYDISNIKKQIYEKYERFKNDYPDDFKYFYNGEDFDIFEKYK